jgi:hypothetical protein
VPLSRVHVAGASPLNRDAPRISGDIDVFHDREEQVAAALADAQTLAAAGYRVAWLRQLPLMYTAEVTREGAATGFPKETLSGGEYLVAALDPRNGEIDCPSLCLRLDAAQSI